MKSILTIAIFVIALSMFAPMIVSADVPAPQPWQYAAVQCSGLGTVENVVYATNQFDAQYGFDHQLTTPGMWQASYIARTNQFASSIGCPQVLWDDGTLSGSLTMFYRVYVPWYQKYSQSYAVLKSAQTK